MMMTMMRRISILGCVGFLAMAAQASDAPPPIDDRSITDLQEGSTFTLKQDIYIGRNETSSKLDGSTTDTVTRCFLQTFAAKANDRVVRAGRTITLTVVTLKRNFFALSVDDGRPENDHVIAQIGCNLKTPGWSPLVSELRAALDASFDMDLKDAPIEEVNLPIGTD